MVVKKISLNYLILFIIIGVFIILGSVYAVSDPGHSADEILVTINNYIMTLQEAIDNGFLMEGGAVPSQDYTTNLNPSHLGSEIKINLGGTTTTIQDAIDSGTIFCRDQNSIFSGILSLGHGSDKVEVTVEEETMTFQNAINSKKFCYTFSWKASSWSACDVPQCSDCASNPCGYGTMTRTVWCEREDGKKFANSYCSNAGTKFAESQSCERDASGVGICGRTTTTIHYCTHDCPTGNEVLKETITNTCAGKFDTVASRQRFCTMTDQTETITNTWNTPCNPHPINEYTNKIPETADGPYLMICVPTYTENQWISNPFNNARIPQGQFVLPDSIKNKNYQYIYLKCDWDLSNIHCGSANDGCLVWFSYHKGDESCYTTPTRNNDDCNALDHLWGYSANNCVEAKYMVLRGCSSAKSGYCRTSKDLDLCASGCTALPEEYYGY